MEPPRRNRLEARSQSSYVNISQCTVVHAQRVWQEGRTKIPQHLVDDLEGVVHKALIVNNTHLVQRDLLRPCLDHRRVHAEGRAGCIRWEPDVDVVCLVLPAMACAVQL